MKNLSKKEVLAELKKLGINSTSELNSYYKEYKGYSAESSETFLIKILRKIEKTTLTNE
jgi:hypothetical protein